MNAPLRGRSGNVRSPYELHLALEDARQDAENARDAYLRATGWTHTSHTPGCFWLWSKTLPDGRVALVESEMAVQMQWNLDPDPPEQAGDE